MAREKTDAMRKYIKIGPATALHTAPVESQGTLMFDVTGPANSMVCTNITHAQAREIRSILNAFIETEPKKVTLHITATPERIQALYNDPTLKVINPDEDW